MRSRPRRVIVKGKGQRGVLVTGPKGVEWEVCLPEECDPSLRTRFGLLEPQTRVTMKFDESRTLLGSNFPEQKTLRTISGDEAFEARVAAAESAPSAVVAS
jgi:hypothetical protein